MEQDVEVTVVSPSPNLVIRPRLYEAAIEGMAPDLTALLQAVGVEHVAGRVESICSEAREISVAGADGRRTLGFDKFVLATGSTLNHAPVPGLAEHALTSCIPPKRLTPISSRWWTSPTALRAIRLSLSVED